VKAKEIIVWGLPAGEQDPLKEAILSTQCHNQTDVERIRRVASADGWHSFRCQIIDGSKPDFVGTLNV